VNWDKVVGDNIRGYRVEQSLSQEALAIKSKMSSNYLGEVERGKETISVRRIVLVAKALKIEPNLLLIPDSWKKKAK
jgi:transcriptional regulator with XRE-family HTH domain